MRAGDPVAESWRASLALGFAGRDGKTILSEKRHEGPLVVQKPFYPEGDPVCHAIVVHPPGGIAGGDELEIDVRVAERAHGLLTTPGAARWYRSAGLRASQRLSFAVGGDLEWLPQETIVFDGALAEMQCRVDLARGARYLGWEILCLGRRGSGERFGNGTIRLDFRLSREGKPLWIERGTIEGGGRLMSSPAGLAGRSVCATFLGCGEGLSASLLSGCRKVPQVAATLLPGVLVARYLGDSSEEAKERFTEIWRTVRPALLGREAREPRIWRT
jgi:urease accessory protein